MFAALVALVVGAAAPDPVSVPVRLNLVLRLRAAAPINGTLTFVPAMGPAEPVTIACCEGELTVMLPAHTAWEMRPRLRGAWAAKEMIVAGDSATAHNVTVWPLAQVKGRLQTEKGSALPNALRLELVDPPAHKSGIAPGNVVDCALESDGSFQCDVPAFPLDLIFHADGFVPRQLWGGATRDAGLLLLRKGASVCGWVQNGGGSATATLLPLIASGGATSERVARPVAKASVLKNGFFQLVGVPPGQYALRVDRAGYSSETIAPVRVYGGRETAIRKAILLRAPVTLTLSFVPPRDWRDKPWAISISKASPLSGGFDAAPLFDGAASDGRVVLNGQGAARFSVDIFDSAGNPLENEQFDIDGSADTAHEIRVDVITVRGIVEIGETPLETSLWFGGRHGVQHATMRSDAKGVFHGVLPSGGEWRVTAVVDGQDVETTASVRARDGEATVEIRLPDNGIGGVVVDGEGNPVADADVTLMTPRTSATHRSAGNGQFLFRAVEAGDVSLAATLRRDDKLLTSDAVMAQISPDVSPPPVQLVVRDGERLTGTVKSIHGAIPGAAVTVVALLNQITAMSTTTDLEGHFVAQVPASAERAYVTVRPPGYALRVFDVPLPNHGIGLNVPQVGGTLEIVFPKTSSSSVGLLLFQDGRPLPLPEVARWAMSHGTPPSNAGIRAADMAPALYQACIGTQQLLRHEELGRWIGSARCVTGNLVPFGTLRLEIGDVAVAAH